MKASTTAADVLLFTAALLATLGVFGADPEVGAVPGLRAGNAGHVGVEVADNRGVSAFFRAYRAL